jgi:hypothetical protein
LLDEIFICVTNLKMSYGDVLKMPTYERRYFLSLFKKQIDNSESTTQTSSGKSKTITGEALKDQLKNGKIPT